MPLFYYITNMLSPDLLQKFTAISFPPFFGPRDPPKNKPPPVRKNTIPEECKLIHEKWIDCLATYRECSTSQCSMCSDFQKNYESCVGKSIFDIHKEYR